jgi:hypothetical protein
MFTVEQLQGCKIESFFCVNLLDLRKVYSVPKWLLINGVKNSDHPKTGLV